ncbi:UNVERIFIED_CONTAM: hypothetical protein Scaly_3042500 [Sesamum calycinum]|uniref:Protein TIC 214 n=1 Tax=Sesamum calycinum TaxID=2727403 RepID=A0AAW2K696_9LAMI
MNKDKDRPGTSKGYDPKSYRSAFEKDEKILREEALKAVPEENKLREDAYKIAVKSASTKEYVYPYIPISTIWISPIERKYSHLSSEEVMNFYLKNFTDPFVFPKDFLYYQEILISTGSVQFDSTSRSGGEWAFSKAFIHRVITPEQWEGDLYRVKEIQPESRNPHKSKFYFNYFDYIKAWDIAFCYENRQRKHSWFIQFKDQKIINFPNWFICWFANWGLYPIILPHKIRNIYEDFVKTNETMKNHGLMFTALYQIPWIVKWDVVIIHRSLQKLGEDFSNIPYLGRRILIKWWDKFEFFKDSVFSIKGIINLEPVKPPSQEKPQKQVTDILKELLSKSSKQELKQQLKEILESSDDEDMSQSTEPVDSMQEAQDPFL